MKTDKEMQELFDSVKEDLIFLAKKFEGQHFGINFSQAGNLEVTFYGEDGWKTLTFIAPRDEKVVIRSGLYKEA